MNRILLQYDSILDLISNLEPSSNRQYIEGNIIQSLNAFKSDEDINQILEPIITITVSLLSHVSSSAQLTISEALFLNSLVLKIRVLNGLLQSSKTKLH